MATILQVNANTSQAVGAFNNLANAIANARGQFNQFHVTINQGNTYNRQYGDSVTRGIAGAFDKLSNALSYAYKALTMVGTALQFMFSSIIRELDKLQGFNAIMSVTTKSSEGAAAAYSYLRTTADRLGQQFDSLSTNYSKLMASLPEGNDRMRTAEKVFLGVAMAARTLHSSNQDTQLMFYAITQMASKGNVSMEELRRQLGEKLPGALQIAARAVNTTPELLEKAIRTGSVNSAKFLELFGDELIRTFVDSSEKASQSVSAAINRLTNVWIDFVKKILDSGAGDAIAKVFDQIREKLQDPYVIERFAQFIKYLAEQFTEFIRKLTADDIRNGFDTFSKGVEMAVNVAGKLIEAFTWIINNSGKVGAVLGAAIGGITGLMTGNPIIGLVGAAIGGTGGAYLGNAIKPSNEDYAARVAQDKSAQEASKAAAIEQARIITQYITPLMRSFNVTVDKVPGLFKAEALNMGTVDKMVKLLSDPRFKTQASRQEALVMLSKTGQVLAPNTSTLADVMGPGKPGKPKRPSAEENRLESNMWRAYGFNGDFIARWNDYNKLVKSGQLSTEQLEKAQKKLLDQQPFMVERLKAQKDASEELNRELNSYLDGIFRQLEVRDDVSRSLDTELRMASLRSDEYETESRAMQEVSRLAEVGYDLRAKGNEAELKALYDKIRLIRDTALATQAENAVLDQTVNRFDQQIAQLNAIKKLRADPQSGLSQQDSQDLVIRQNPELFAGSNLSLQSQRRQWEDLFSYIRALKNAQVIDEATKNQLIAEQTELMAQRMRDAYVKVSESRLALGSGDWSDHVIASLGKIVDGFSTMASGATSAMGDLFKSMTDGFADSVGRAVVYSDNLGEALNNVAKQAISSLISALVKLGMQWLVNAALGKSLAAATMASTLAMSTAAGAATAAAWAPAAAMVSLASFGANAAPAMTGIAATSALSSALAALPIPGFDKGGYTGDIATNRVAGVVHGQEFVVNAAATARNRPILESINRGSTVSKVSQSTSGESKRPINISVTAAPGIDINYRELTEDDVEIIATRVVQKRASQTVANDLRRPNSQFSKALKRNTNTEFTLP